jgi:hypothetical protein
MALPSSVNSKCDGLDSNNCVNYRTTRLIFDSNKRTKMLGLSKEQQLKSNRLKPKKVSTFGKCPMKGRIKKTAVKNRATTDELEYLTWFSIKDLECFACGTLKGVKGHHIKENSCDKKQHFKILPLCEIHHTGTELSPHGTPKKFRQTYPMKVQNDYADKIRVKYLKEIL